MPGVGQANDPPPRVNIDTFHGDAFEIIVIANGQVYARENFAEIQRLGVDHELVREVADEASDKCALQTDAGVSPRATTKPLSTATTSKKSAETSLFGSTP